jgi:hypothetical protein
MDHLAPGSNVFARQSHEPTVNESADHGAAQTVCDQEWLRRASVSWRRKHGECTALFGIEHYLPGNSARTRVRYFPSLPSFVIVPLHPVEELSGFFVGKHHADIAGRNPRRTFRIKFVALDKRHAFVESIIRNTNASANQRGRLDDDNAM